jgi:hypothetical protein
VLFIALWYDNCVTKTLLNKICYRGISNLGNQYVGDRV